FGLDVLGRPYRYHPTGGEGMLLARLSGGDERTPWVRWGWVLPEAALAGTLLALAATLVRRRMAVTR
ncbi:MAG TPA: hypothetical protein VFF73_15330, partial [Planctomycetota bacterium]|nr:hypothetical protein [Planctomycetota bacterium]